MCDKFQCYWITHLCLQQFCKVCEKTKKKKQEKIEALAIYTLEMLGEISFKSGMWTPLSGGQF